MMEKSHKFYNNELAYHAAKQAELWMIEAKRLKSELLHRDINIIPEKDSEYLRLRKAMIEIIRDLYNASKRYEDKYQGLYEWEIPSFNKAKEILKKEGFPEHKSI